MHLPVAHFLVPAEGHRHPAKGTSATGDSPAAAHSLPLYDDPASSGFINHVDDKPASLTHLSVKVPCQLCEGRGHYVDIVDKGDKRILVRKRCEACKGTGSIDISKGPVTDDLAPHEAFIASLRLSNKRERLAHCENCGGDGGWLEPCGRFDVCPCCEGTGELPTAERTLINLDDLDTINRDKPLENFDADAA